MARLIRIIFLGLISIHITGCTHLSKSREPAASEPFAPVATGSVFASYQPLNLELDAPLNILFIQERKDFAKFKEKKVDGQLSYINEQKKKISFPVSINIKGWSTAVFCSFPKLELKFKDKDRSGTPFADTKTIDLNTHCGESLWGAGTESLAEVAHFNHREALLYRMAEVLRIPTFKARPVYIRYRNTKISKIDRKPQTFRAFLLEDMGSFTKRLNGREIRGVADPKKDLKLPLDPEKASMYAFTDVQSTPQVDREDAARIALFQYMIGNSDWYIKIAPNSQRAKLDPHSLWNVKIIELPSGKWVLFPQDFSLSGIVGGYATELDKEIFGVVDSATQNRLKKAFLDKKTELYDLVDTLKDDPVGVQLMKYYLDKFYSSL